MIISGFQYPMLSIEKLIPLKDTKRPPACISEGKFFSKSSICSISLLYIDFAEEGSMKSEKPILGIACSGIW